MRASRKESAFISPAANEAFRTNISPRLKASRVKDNSSAARHGSSHLRKYFGRKYYCVVENEVAVPSDAEFWSKLIDKGAGGLCKISGCVNLCGPLRSYPEDLQQKVATGN